MSGIDFKALWDSLPCLNTPTLTEIRCHPNVEQRMRDLRGVAEEGLPPQFHLLSIPIITSKFIPENLVILNMSDGSIKILKLTEEK